MINGARNLPTLSTGNSKAITHHQMELCWHVLHEVMSVSVRTMRAACADDPLQVLCADCCPTRSGHTVAHGGEDADGLDAIAPIVNWLRTACMSLSHLAALHNF